MNDTAGVLTSIALGFAPMLFFAWIVYWVDRYEKEPRLLLFFVNSFLGLGIYLFTHSATLTDLTTGSLIAPVVEECLKGFGVLIVFLVFRREFDSILDGIIYASITALGFAATENAYYIFAFGFKDNGPLGILVMFFVRVVLVGWQHPFYTCFTGIGLAIARLSGKRRVKILAPAAGLGFAILTHSLHNTLASLLPGLGGLATGTLVDWTGWFMMFLFVLWALHREQRWIVDQLKEEVSLKLISPAQYRVACSAWLQTASRLKALFAGQYRATQRFYQVAAELAYKKQQRIILGEEGGNSTIIENLRTELALLAPVAEA